MDLEIRRLSFSFTNPLLLYLIALQFEKTSAVIYYEILELPISFQENLEKADANAGAEAASALAGSFLFFRL